MPRHPCRTPAALFAVAAFCLAAEAAPGQPPPVDQLGDPLPAGAVARIGTTRWRHGASCSFVAFLPDGKTVVSAGYDGQVRVWQFPSGKEVRRLGPGLEPYASGRPFFGRVAPVALTADGVFVATELDGGELVIYAVGTGKEVGRLPQPKDRSGGRIFGMEFSPDSKFLAVMDVDGGVVIWDRATAKEARTFQGGDPASNDFAMPVLRYNKDGTGVLTVHGNFNMANNQETFHAILRDPATGKEVWKATLKPNVGATAADFSSDGKLLALANEDGTVTILDAATGKEHRTFGEQLGNDICVRFASGSTLFTLDRSGRVTQWDAAAGKLLRELQGDPRVRLAGGGFAFAGGRLAIAPDGKTVALCDGGNYPKFLDTATGKQVAEAPGPAAGVLGVQFSADGKQIWTRSLAGGLEVWDAATGKALGTKAAPAPGGVGPGFGGGGGPAGAAANRAWPSPDGKMLAQFLRGTKGFQLTDIDTGKVLGSFPAGMGGKGKGTAKSIAQAAWAGDSKTLAVRWPQSQVIEICAAPSLEVKVKIPIISGIRTPGQPPNRTPPAPGTLIFSGDGSLLAGYSDGTTFTVWDATTGKKRVDLRAPERHAVAAGVFTDGDRSLAVTINDGTVLLFELASGEVRRVYGLKLNLKGPRMSTPAFGLNDPGADAPLVAVSPDGKRLAAACPDNVIRVWDAATGKALAEFKGHTGTVFAVAFSPDGSRLASASGDTTALVWDVAALKAPPAGKPLTNAEVEARWAALVGGDATKAFDAVCELAASPKEAVALLAGQLKPAERIDPKLLDQLIADLDSAEYKVRSRANAELLKLGEAVVPAVDKVLAGPLPLETKTRLENLRAKLADLVLTGERLRAWRAVEVLERIGTPEAREVLQRLSEGAPGALLTEHAKAALKRAFVERGA
jgi:WD40 repeat protein